MKLRVPAKGVFDGEQRLEFVSHGTQQAHLKPKTVIETTSEPFANWLQSLGCVPVAETTATDSVAETTESEEQDLKEEN